LEIQHLKSPTYSISNHLKYEKHQSPSWIVYMEPFANVFIIANFICKGSFIINLSIYIVFEQIFIIGKHVEYKGRESIWTLILQFWTVGSYT